MKNRKGNDFKRLKKICRDDAIIIISNKTDGKTDNEEDIRWQIYYPDESIGTKRNGYRWGGVTANRLAIFFNLLANGVTLREADAMAFRLSRKSGKYAKVHPGMMLIGFIGGVLAMGLKGIIIGPIALGSLKIILDHYKK